LAGACCHWLRILDFAHGSVPGRYGSKLEIKALGCLDTMREANRYEPQMPQMNYWKLFNGFTHAHGVNVLDFSNVVFPSKRRSGITYWPFS
jgi:hypothetical protein